eukprot:SAG31_NODE_1386_length_8574_cov_2.055037_14_plen_114_part_00
MEAKETDCLLIFDGEKFELERVSSTAANMRLDIDPGAWCLHFVPARAKAGIRFSAEKRSQQLGVHDGVDGAQHNSTSSFSPIASSAEADTLLIRPSLVAVRRIFVKLPNLCTS